MLGWEFPPFFSGGLGVVTKNLAVSLGKRDLELCFALPYYIRKSVPDTAVPAGVFLADYDEKKMQSALEAYTSLQYIPTSIPSPYTSPDQYDENIKYIQGVEAKSTWISSTKEHASGRKEVYGKDLWHEIDRFAHQMELFVEGRNFDMVHAHDWITCEAGIRLKQKLGVPLLVHVHATEIDRTGGAINPEVFKREQYAFEFCDRIVTVSHYTKSILVEQYEIDPDKIYVVHNAHNIESRPSHIALPQWIEGKDDDDFVVLFIGRLTLQKGPDFFIKTAQKVLKHNKRIKFVLAGTGDMMPRIMQDIVENNMENNVFCLGFMSGAEKEKVYQNADVCLIPSVSEPFGLIALEAVEYGVPVLISNNSGAKEVLTHSLKADFWDVDQMAHYVESLYRYPSLRAMLIKESFKETQHLSWDAQAERLHEIYEQLIYSK